MLKQRKYFLIAAFVAVVIIVVSGIVLLTWSKGDLKVDLVTGKESSQGTSVDTGKPLAPEQSTNPMKAADTRDTSVNDEKANFLNSFEGHQFEILARKFVKACLTNDVETMKKFALNPNDKELFSTGLDLYDKTSFIILKLQKVAKNSVIADFEFDVKGEDSLKYLNVEMVKVGNEWKVKNWGLQQ